MKAQYFVNSFQKLNDLEFSASISLLLENEEYFRTAASYNSTPVVPGSFQIEFAYELLALIMEAGELHEFSLVDIQFLQVPKFIRPDLHLKIDAVKTTENEFDLTLTSELKDKSGKVFSKILHSRMQAVRFAHKNAIEIPHVDEASAYIDPDIPRVLYMKNAPLRLGTYFDCVGETLISNKVRRSIYRFSFPLEHRAFSSHCVPPLLIDAVLQNALKRMGPHIEVGIPKSIGRLTLFKSLSNDANLNHKFPELQLICIVDESKYQIEVAQIISMQGEVILQVESAEFTSLGYIDTRTGEFKIAV